MISTSKLIQIVGGHEVNRDGCNMIFVEDTRDILNQDESIPVIEAARVIAADGFGVDVQLKSLEGIRDHLINVSACAFVCLGELMGFASVKIFDELDVLYLHGIAMRTDCQSKGLGKRLLQEIINLYPKSKITFTTQNPVMYDVLNSLCCKVYPSPQNHIVPTYLQELGAELMAGRRGKFSKETFVSEGLYQKCLYDKIPQSKNSSVDQWFQHALCMENRKSKDGLLFIGEIVSGEHQKSHVS